MLWLDGHGADGKGVCVSDTPELCADSVNFSGFTVTDIKNEPTTANVATTTTRTTTKAPSAVVHLPVVEPSTTWQSPPFCSFAGENCLDSKCCSQAGMQCYKKDQWWASCTHQCTPGVDTHDERQFQTPWQCAPLGFRTPLPPPPPTEPSPGSEPVGPSIFAYFVLVVMLGGVASVIFLVHGTGTQHLPESVVQSLATADDALTRLGVRAAFERCRQGTMFYGRQAWDAVVFYGMRAWEVAQAYSPRVWQVVQHAGRLAIHYSVEALNLGLSLLASLNDYVFPRPRRPQEHQAHAQGPPRHLALAQSTPHWPYVPRYGSPLPGSGVQDHHRVPGSTPPDGDPNDRHGDGPEGSLANSPTFGRRVDMRHVFGDVGFGSSSQPLPDRQDRRQRDAPPLRPSLGSEGGILGGRRSSSPPTPTRQPFLGFAV